MSSSPKWFRPVAVIALLWNLAGCAAYLADVSLSPAQISAMSPAQQALYAERPAWSVAATAIAVWVGAAGCLGLGSPTVRTAPHRHVRMVAATAPAVERPATS